MPLWTAVGICVYRLRWPCRERRGRGHPNCNFRGLLTEPSVLKPRRDPLAACDGRHLQLTNPVAWLVTIAAFVRDPMVRLPAPTPTLSYPMALDPHVVMTSIRPI